MGVKLNNIYKMLNTVSKQRVILIQQNFLSSLLIGSLLKVANSVLWPLRVTRVGFDYFAGELCHRNHGTTKGRDWKSQFGRLVHVDTQMPLIKKEGRRKEEGVRVWESYTGLCSLRVAGTLEEGSLGLNFSLLLRSFLTFQEPRNFWCLFRYIRMTAASFLQGALIFRNFPFTRGMLQMVLNAMWQVW